MLEQRRAAKAAELRPYRPKKVEARLFDIEDRYRIQRWLNPPRGFFPRLGGFPTGSGPIAGGPAFRHSNYRMNLTLSSAVSTYGYWDAGGTLALTNQARKRVFGDVSARRREYLREDYYGLGPGSQAEAQTSYAFRETSVAGSLGVAPAWWISLSGSAELASIGLGSGHDPKVPSIEAGFTDATAPGLTAQPDFVRVGASVSLDSTGRPFGSHYGGHHVVSYDRFLDPDLDAYSFDRWSLDLRQYLPVLGSTRTLALRGQLVSVTPDQGHEVPFYHQPTLGGPDSLRGLTHFRLRDRNVLLLQAEYRWDLNAFLGAVLFYDAGTVARRLGDLRLDELRHDYGAGLRIGFLGLTVLRAEVAFGAGEGTLLLVKLTNVY